MDVAANHLVKRKELGVFYTPSSLTSLLSEWAIRSKHEQILEPSFGGCGFLEAAIDRLKAISCKAPRKNLYGCDVDPSAFGLLAEKIGIANLDRRFLLSDFLTTSTKNFTANKFDVVLGNPPYVSHHNFTDEQKRTVEAWRTKSPFKINGRASLWAYFVLHALDFIKDGGRMAWVLPGSFFYSRYAEAIQTIVASRFKHAHAIFLGERMFLDVGTEERTVLLLCEGYQENLDAGELKVDYCESLAQLKVVLNVSDAQRENPPTTSVISSLGHFPHFSSAHAAMALTHEVQCLGSIARVLIGIVTGANHYFILKPSQIDFLRLSKRHTKLIVPKFGLLEGLSLTDEDTNKWLVEDKACMLYSVADKRISRADQAYISSFPEEERLRNSTFKRRTNWLDADDHRIPDAFLSYMNHHGPRLVLNTCGLNATNSIHRVFFSESLSEQKRKLISISLLTTYSQLSAELCGRSYGSGVLKLEPSEARNIRIALPRMKDRTLINATFVQIDKLLRTNDIVAAQQVADRFVFGDNPLILGELIKHLNRELDMIRTRRRRGKADA